MVRWKPSLRTTAGQAHAATQILYLNPRVAAFGADEIERTFLHELAHLVAHARHGRRRIRAHGPEWRQACADLGIPGETATHALPIPRRQVAKPFAYRCPACATILRRTRPIRGKAACAACCRRHNRGRYDDRFRLARLAQP
jgi:predicted SprT family Zn-dependent metalloprotease